MKNKKTKKNLLNKYLKIKLIKEKWIKLNELTIDRSHRHKNIAVGLESFLLESWEIWSFNKLKEFSNQQKFPKLQAKTKLNCH